MIKVIIVGAFPKKETSIHGGVLTSCKLLMSSSLPKRIDILEFDSTQSRVPPPPFITRLIYGIWRVLSLTIKYITFRPQVVLLFASPGASIIEKSFLAAIASLLGIKVLLFPRGAQIIDDYYSSTIYARLLKLILQIPHKILCQGEIYKTFLLKEIKREPSDCPVIYNWTATNELLEVGKNRNYVNKKLLTILFMGWVDKEKGVFELIEAVKKLKEDNNNSFKLIIAGKGKDLEKIRKYTEVHELSDIISFPGWVGLEERVDLFNNSDVLILPSYVEGMPNVVIEAMATGMPVIASDVGTVSEMISSEINGLIIRPQSSKEIYKALNTLIQNSYLVPMMGKAAWKEASIKYRPERAADQLIESIEGVLFD